MDAGVRVAQHLGGDDLGRGIAQGDPDVTIEANQAVVDGGRTLTDFESRCVSVAGIFHHHMSQNRALFSQITKEQALPRSGNWLFNSGGEEDRQFRSSHSYQCCTSALPNPYQSTLPEPHFHPWLNGEGCNPASAPFYREQSFDGVGTSCQSPRLITTDGRVVGDGSFRSRDFLNAAISRLVKRQSLLTHAFPIYPLLTLPATFHLRRRNLRCVNDPLDVFLNILKKRQGYFLGHSAVHIFLK